MNGDNVMQGMDPMTGLDPAMQAQMQAHRQAVGQALMDAWMKARALGQVRPPPDYFSAKQPKVSLEQGTPASTGPQED